MDVSAKAIWFVESHLRTPVSLEEIASACGVSAYHLTRAFSTAKGLPLMRYVRRRRLSQAARALAGGADDILALAPTEFPSNGNALPRISATSRMRSREPPTGSASDLMMKGCLITSRPLR